MNANGFFCDEKEKGMGVENIVQNLLKMHKQNVHFYLVQRSCSARLAGGWVNQFYGLRIFFQIISEKVHKNMHKNMRKSRLSNRSHGKEVNLIYQSVSWILLYYRQDFSASKLPQILALLRADENARKRKNENCEKLDIRFIL